MQEKRTFAEINLKRYKDNLASVFSTVSPGTKVMALIKADGYGHGANVIARAAMTAGVSYLGVANVSEAYEVFQELGAVPLFVLAEPVDDHSSDIIDMAVTQAIYTRDVAARLNAAARLKNKKVKVHLKVDTGMGRVGCKIKDAPGFIEFLLKQDSLILEGIFTHFANADNPDSAYTDRQIDSFIKLKNELSAKNIPIKFFHAANSAALVNYPQSHLNMVRVGIASYKGVMTLKSRVGFIKSLPAGSHVSYGSEFCAPRKTNIATVMIGYGDGYPKSLSNRGKVFINGQIYPIVGRICMDMLMIDVGENQYSVKIGDEVILWGEGFHPRIDVAEICETAEKIPYELLCAIHKRVPRIYI